MNTHIGHDKAFASKEFPEPEPVPNKNVYLKELEKSLNIKNLDDDPYDFDGKKIWMLINFELWMRAYID